FRFRVTYRINGYWTAIRAKTRPPPVIAPAAAPYKISDAGSAAKKTSTRTIKATRILGNIVNLFLSHTTFIIYRVCSSSDISIRRQKREPVIEQEAKRRDEKGTDSKQDHDVCQNPD